MGTNSEVSVKLAHADNPAEFVITAPAIGGSLLVTVLTIVGTIMHFRRKLSRDNLEIAKDSSEKKLLTTITEERDRAVASAEVAWKTRTEDAQLIGQLTSEVKHLTITNTSLINDVAGLRSEISQLREVIYGMLPPNIAAQLRDRADLNATQLAVVTSMQTGNQT